MIRNLIIGDIHSQYDKLLTVLDKAGFDSDKDTLYSVGDFCDRGEDAVKTLYFLMKLKNFKAVIGNHDILFQEWLYKDIPDFLWKDVLGGDRTIEDVEVRHKLSREELIRIAAWLTAMPYVRV